MVTRRTFRGVGRRAWAALPAVALLWALAACGPEGEPVAGGVTHAVGPDGGTIVLEGPESPLPGLTLTVPAGAYPDGASFSISTRPCQREPTPKLTPLSPRIRVEVGDVFAERAVTVTVPITLPEGMFALGFFVDTDGGLEPMPIVDLTPESITIATRHFSEFLIGAIALTELPDKIRTPFLPGRDDWPFPNHGSYISQGGHCAGQVVTMGWYFWERALRGEAALHGRYDNNDRAATREVWEDDSLGYRLASTVQEDLDFETDLRETFNAMGEVAPSLVWNAFLYSMHLTDEPQYVAVYDTDQGGGHALLAYGADRESGVLYVADPNYPGDASRVLVFFGGVWVPYVSGRNLTEILAGKTWTYEEVIYTAKTAMIPWAKVGARWAEFEAGTIGKDRFPGYGLLRATGGGGGVAFPETYRTSDASLDVWITAVGTHKLEFQLQTGNGWSARVGSMTVPLAMGANELGFCVWGERGGKWEWVDFQWITVERIDPEPEPEPEPEEDPPPPPTHDAVITGVYYGELQSNTRRRGMMLFVTSEDGKIPYRTAYEIVSEKLDDFGNVVETRFAFRRGMGSPGIPPGRRRVCAGPRPGEWTARSAAITVRASGSHDVTVGTAPPGR